MPQATMHKDILHFNDVYHVAPAKDDPVGGASRFAAALKSTTAQDPLVLFSGDVFGPSIEGSVTRGAHMPDVMNALSINVACVGNHDFDFGVPQLRKLLHQCTFPWLISNVLYEDGGQPPSPLKRWHVLDHGGMKLGVIGLVEEEWIQTIPSFPTDLVYHDFIEVANELSTMLREGPEKVDLVIALTHMRVANDVKLATQASTAVDLILGGHDHFYYVSNSIEIIGDDDGTQRQDNLKEVGYDPEHDVPEGTTPLRIVKSGTDFREFSQLRLTIDVDAQGKKYIQHMTAEHHSVTSSLTPDPTMETIVSKVSDLVSSHTKRPIGYTTVALDGRSSKVRTQETNFGNLTADLMLAAYASLQTYPAEIALCCGGTIRNDSVMEVGELTLGDVLLAFPFTDPVVVVRLTGQQIWDAMENSVSEYPKQEGRFPQVAGIKVTWSSQSPPGQRIQSISCVGSGDSYDLGGTPLVLDKEYSVVTREYMVLGYDGYTALKVPDDKLVVDGENGVFISTIFRRFFLGLKYVNAFREHCTKHGYVDGAAVTEPTKDHVDHLVASIARHWKKEAIGKTNHHGISLDEALHGSQLGHPSCLDDDNDDEASSPLYDDHELKQSQQASWAQRWATISPTVQGRLVQID